MKVFSDGGYNGYMSSEYEGHGFTDAYPGFDMIEKHQALCKKLLAENR
ncbi:MAG: hypothetical protein JST75_01620 [Bacteroidetes bacterium]|nr:hypothetical protein [Bacteroidota bacterium]